MVGILLALLVAASPASAIVKCRTADGKLIFADVAPAGCTPEGEYKNAPPAGDGAINSPAEPGGDSDEVTRLGGVRTKLDRAANRAGEELEKLRTEIKRYPANVPGHYDGTAAGLIAFQAVNRQRDEIVSELKAKERALLEEIAGLQRQLDDLSDSAKEANGGTLPAWWNPKLKCRKCP